MLLKPAAVTKSLSRGFLDSEIIVFELIPEPPDVLEISTDSVVCHPFLYRIRYERDGQRNLLKPQLTIRRGRSIHALLPRTEDANFDRWKDAVGIMTLSRSKYRGPSFYFQVTLNPRTFDDLAHSISSGAIPTEIAIGWSSFYGDSRMDFGWEPDGSRQIWNIPEDQWSQWPIESFDLITTIMESHEELEESQDSLTDDNLSSKNENNSPPISPAISPENLVTEIRNVNEEIVRLSKIVKVGVALVALIGLIVLAIR